MRFFSILSTLFLLFFTTNVLARGATIDEFPNIYTMINNNDQDAFALFLATGGDVDETNMEGSSPLMIATMYRKAEFVDFLIGYDANVNHRNYDGVTALHVAAANGDNDIVNILLDSGAFIDMPDLKGVTPLMEAIKNNKKFTVELLLRRRASINNVDSKGRSALDYAVRANYVDLIKYLKANGAK